MCLSDVADVFKICCLCLQGNRGVSGNRVSDLGLLECNVKSQLSEVLHLLKNGQFRYSYKERKAVGCDS